MSILLQRDINEIIGKPLRVRFVCDEGEDEIKDVSFSHLQMYGSTFHRIKLKNVVFTDCILGFSEFGDMQMDNVRFRRCSMKSSAFTDVALNDVIFSECFMDFASFVRASYSRVLFEKSYLHSTSFYQTDMNGTAFRDCHLSDNDFETASNVPQSVCDMFNIIPKGSYTGWKKARDGKIVELRIPPSAKRSSATTRKCRAEKARVVSIENCEGTRTYATATSLKDPFFKYIVNKPVHCNDFDENRWSECSGGIHHFLTREEAVEFPEY